MPFEFDGTDLIRAREGLAWRSRSAWVGNNKNSGEITFRLPWLIRINCGFSRFGEGLHFYPAIMRIYRWSTWCAAMSLFTFGYEGQSIGGFIARLKKAGVEVVIDVRELPLSRKKGFSKTAFAAALQNAGIAYGHLPVFGCPKPIRNRYKLDGNWKRYEKAFRAYLATQTTATADLAKFSSTTKACLVCFEADFRVCHRSLVARAAADAGGATVIHLTATAEIADRSLQLAA